MVQILRRRIKSFALVTSPLGSSNKAFKVEEAPFYTLDEVVDKVKDEAGSIQEAWELLEHKNSLHFIYDIPGGEGWEPGGWYFKALIFHDRALFYGAEAVFEQDKTLYFDPSLMVLVRF